MSEKMNKKEHFYFEIDGVDSVEENHKNKTVEIVIIRGLNYARGK